MTSNRAIVLRRAAKDAQDVPGALAIENREPPPVSDGEVRIRAVYLSLDPSMFTWIRTTAPYMPTGVGDVLMSQAIGVVEESRLDGFAPGQLVSTFAGMQEVSVVKAHGTDHDGNAGGPQAVKKIERDPRIPLHAHLSLFSHIGMAAITGIKEVAAIRAGETVLVSAAAGATGSVAAQLAKAYGARVIGIAGGPEKCRYLTEELELDAAVDHRADVGAQLDAAAPHGVDVFFDNVGGPLLDTVLTRLAAKGRVVICGAISQYGLSPDEVYRYANIGELLMRRAHMLGYWVTDYNAGTDAYFAELREHYLDGAIKLRPAHVVDGLEAIPDSLALLLDGRNTGKLMAQVSPPPY